MRNTRDVGRVPGYGATLLTKFVARRADAVERLPVEAAARGRVVAAAVDRERRLADRRDADGRDLDVDEVAAVELEAAVAEVRIDERRREADLIAVRAGVIARVIGQPVDLVDRVRGAAAVRPADAIRGRARCARDARSAGDDAGRRVACRRRASLPGVAAAAVAAAAPPSPLPPPPPPPSSPSPDASTSKLPSSSPPVSASRFPSEPRG